MKNASLALVCAVIIVIACGSALASGPYSSRDTSKIGLKMQFLYPQGGILSKIADPWITPAFDVNLQFDQKSRPVTYMSYARFKEEGGGLIAKLEPVTITRLTRIDASNDKFCWYFGYGLGYYKMSITEKYRQSFEESKLGMHFIGGIEFAKGWFAEIRYDHAGKISNDRVNPDFSGIGAAAGIRLAF